MNRALTNVERQTIADAYLSGLTAREVARRFNVHTRTVSNCVLRCGYVMRRSGSPSGPTNPHWKGGWACGGYRYVRAGTDDPVLGPMLMKTKGGRGDLLEHRAVMAQALGRPLWSSETVHHINGDRADNRIENLQLRHGHHGPGQKFRCQACGSTDVTAVAL